MQDIDVASGLYDRFEAGDWPNVREQLLVLAALGGADGTQRATAMLGRDDAGERRRGAAMLRLVGADKATLDDAIAKMLAGDGEAFALGLELVWEFQVASEELRKQLEASYEAAESVDERRMVLRAMVRGGAFTTAWLLARRGELDATERARLDYFVSQASDAVFARWQREREKVTDEAMAAVLDGWLRARAANVELAAEPEAASPASLLADRAAQPRKTARRWHRVTGDAGALLVPRLLVDFLRPAPFVDGAESFAHVVAMQRRAADRAGARLKIARPLLEWLAPRRPPSFRAWLQ